MADVVRKVVGMRPDYEPPHPDRLIAEFANRQHGVVARRQLRALGLTDSAVSRRVASGHLHRVHHGVYAVGHRVLGVRGRWMAAVLAGGPGAVLSHASAAALWEIRGGSPRRTDITTRLGGREREGLRVHRSRCLTPDEVTTRHGIPVTAPARTVLDLAATLNRDQLKRLLDQVELRELTDYPALDALARARAGHRGAARLRRALATYEAGSDRTKSGLERLFRTICQHHGLPQPNINHRPAGREVDFLFPATPPHRRDRLLALSQDQKRLRGRPGPRRHPHPSRLPHPPLHRPPARNRSGRSGANDQGGPESHTSP
jgi:Transcriptional regulator, AbiEi antitoxin